MHLAPERSVAILESKVRRRAPQKFVRGISAKFMPYRAGVHLVDGINYNHSGSGIAEGQW